MYTGKRINTTEDRSVLHVALRLPEGKSLELDGKDVNKEV
jgi:glucose-6-phosphate isomerase